MPDEVPSYLRLTELNGSNSAELTERIEQAGSNSPLLEPRTYPGYPRFSLPQTSDRWWPSIDRVLGGRRCVRDLASRLPTRVQLGRLLRRSHGVNDALGRGPVPSAGGLQAVELYLVNWNDDWLPRGIYHFDRGRLDLAQIVPTAAIDSWIELVPSLREIQGGALLWLIVGDTARTIPKYGYRAERFLLLEAGHLMQNLCLVSASLKLCTVPLGGCLEPEVALVLKLPPHDRVLYCGICGFPVLDTLRNAQVQ